MDAQPTKAFLGIQKHLDIVSGLYHSVILKNYDNCKEAHYKISIAGEHFPKNYTVSECEFVLKIKRAFSGLIGRP